MYLNEESVKAAAQICPSLLEGITESCIMDKSKSNALAKTLVCMQALWFIAQCISRIGQVLPISLLEVSGEHMFAMIISRAPSSNITSSIPLAIVSVLY